MHRSFGDTRLTYGITPPKTSYSEEKRRQTAALQSARIAALPVEASVHMVHQVAKLLGRSRGQSSKPSL